MILDLIECLKGFGMVSVTSVVSEPNSTVLGGRSWRRWWWWWWCRGGCRGCRGGGGGCGRGGRLSDVTANDWRQRFLGHTVVFTATDDDVLAGRSCHLAVVVADVKLRVQLEEVQAPVQRVRLEHVPPHWPALPVETDVPRLVDHRLVPCVAGGQHFLVEQTLWAAEAFLKEENKMP